MNTGMKFEIVYNPILGDFDLVLVETMEEEVEYE